MGCGRQRVPVAGRNDLQRAMAAVTACEAVHRDRMAGGEARVGRRPMEMRAVGPCPQVMPASSIP